ncbi:MAG: hypothetical protein LBF97_05685 [Elusimicrobiota bacterium]|nr:hypothetical protein [Elusimicrobiota bacterium]
MGDLNVIDAPGFSFVLDGGLTVYGIVAIVIIGITVLGSIVLTIFLVTMREPQEIADNVKELEYIQKSN